MERQTPFLFLWSDDFSFLARSYARSREQTDPIDPRVIYALLSRPPLQSISNCPPRSLARRATVHLFIAISSRFDLSCLYFISLYPSVFLSFFLSFFRGNAAPTYARLASTFSSARARNENDGPQATIKILMFYFFLFCRLSQSTKLHPRVLITSIAKTQRGKFSRVSSLLACTPTRCMP